MRAKKGFHGDSPLGLYVQCMLNDTRLTICVNPSVEYGGVKVCRGYRKIRTPGGRLQNSGGETATIFAEGKRHADSAAAPNSHTDVGETSGAYPDAMAIRYPSGPPSADRYSATALSVHSESRSTSGMSRPSLTMNPPRTFGASAVGVTQRAANMETGTTADNLM